MFRTTAMRTKNARKVSKFLGLDHWVVLTNDKGFLNTSICINAHTHLCDFMVLTPSAWVPNDYEVITKS